jgi:hypothetical protein
VRSPRESIVSSDIIRLDVAEISGVEVSDPGRAQFFMNSALVAALTGVPDVGLLLWGQMPTCAFTSTQVTQAHVYYVCNTLTSFREYLIEVLYRSDNPEHRRRCLQRIVRWTFSIVRASLRLFGLWVHPYDDSIRVLRSLSFRADSSVLDRLAEMRRNFSNATSPPGELFTEVETFLEAYVPEVLQRYSDGWTS